MYETVSIFDRLWLDQETLMASGLHELRSRLISNAKQGVIRGRFF